MTLDIQESSWASWNYMLKKVYTVYPLLLVFVNLKLKKMLMWSETKCFAKCISSVPFFWGIISSYDMNVKISLLYDI